MNRAVFLDRDGVIVEDVHRLTSVSQIRILSGVPDTLARWRDDGYRLVVVSNQAVVARGLVSEDEVHDLNAEIAKRIRILGGPAFDGMYFCPHHPEAVVPAYRRTCDCRKPREGMILKACADHAIDPQQSIMIGDRITDILAGQRAGCRTALLETGPSSDYLGVVPDIRCPELKDVPRLLA